MEFVQFHLELLMKKNHYQYLSMFHQIYGIKAKKGTFGPLLESSLDSEIYIIVYNR